jgi:hypothetical protein
VAQWSQIDILRFIFRHYSHTNFHINGGHLSLRRLYIIFEDMGLLSRPQKGRDNMPDGDSPVKRKEAFTLRRVQLDTLFAAGTAKRATHNRMTEDEFIHSIGIISVFIFHSTGPPHLRNINVDVSDANLSVAIQKMLAKHCIPLVEQLKAEEDGELGAAVYSRAGALTLPRPSTPASSSPQRDEGTTAQAPPHSSLLLPLSPPSLASPGAVLGSLSSPVLASPRSVSPHAQQSESEAQGTPRLQRNLSLFTPRRSLISISPLSVITQSSRKKDREDALAFLGKFSAHMDKIFHRYAAVGGFNVLSNQLSESGLSINGKFEAGLDFDK